MCNVEYVCEYMGCSLNSSYALCSSTLLHDMHVYVLATIRYLSDPTDQLIPPNISNNLSLHHTICNIEYVCEYTGRSLNSSFVLSLSTLLHDMHVYMCTDQIN